MLNTPEFLIIHHTGGTNANPLLDTSNHTFEIIDAYHKSLGWEGFGYHYLIEKDGTVRKGRAEDYHGAHTKGYNEKSIGICLSGNFDATLPTKAQEEWLRKLLVTLTDKYKIPKEKIVPHREFATKTCYGRRLADDWAQKLLDEVPLKIEILADLDALRKKVEML